MIRIGLREQVLGHLQADCGKVVVQCPRCPKVYPKGMYIYIYIHIYINIYIYTHMYLCGTLQNSTDIVMSHVTVVNE